MHISCRRIGPIDRSHKQSRVGQYRGIGTITGRKQLSISSHLLGLINLLIIGNNSLVGLHASPSIGPQPGLSFAVSNRQERWNDNARPSPLPAAGGGGNRLQPYQFQLAQPSPSQVAVGVTPGGSQPQPPPQLIRQPTSSTLPPPTQTPTRLAAAASLQRTTLIGLIGNKTTTTQAPPRLPVAGLPVPNPTIIHQHQRAQQVLRQPPNYEPQQVFAPTATNKQVVQPQNLQQHPRVVYATKQTSTSYPTPMTTTTTTPPAFRNSDVTPATGAALFSCLGCDPRGWPLFKSLVSLQNPLLLGGDILVRTGTKRRPISTGMRRLYKSSRSALVDPVSLWPNGVIFYELDESVGHLASLIWRVMQHFHVHTCIRFVPRRNNEPDFVRIGAHRGCSSYIGRIGGEQVLSLGDGCEFRGTIAHELLHAVGFYHHQNRSDRDDFLEILWENVAKGKEDHFRKMSAEENFLLNEFDYNSIMLYGPHTFGKTLDKITMKPKRAGVILLELIEKRGLSALDIDSVNKLYKCDGSVGLSYDLAPELEQPAAAAAAASSR